MDLASKHSDIHDVAQSTYILLAGDKHPSTQSYFKRCLDLLGAILGLVILGILYVPISTAILMETEGAVIFQQTRYGLNGRPFQILKFRTMVEGADDLRQGICNEAKGPIFKCRDDPRVTNVGRFLRSTSLDELPQFWNVIRGEMSLVGTRPPTADEVILYKPEHWLRLRVKPGMTGQWQTSGRSAINDFEDIFALDLDYQKRWDPLYDLVIIFKTVLQLASKKNAW